MRRCHWVWFQAAGWLLQSALAAEQEAPGCHACQLLVQVLHEKVGDVTELRQAKQAKDASRKPQTAAALHRGVVADVLDAAGDVCAVWKTDNGLGTLAMPFGTTQAELVRQCATQVDSLREKLEAELRDASAPEEALRTAVCLGKPGKKRRGHQCAKLWTSEQRPLTKGEAARREVELAAADAEKATRNARLEREFLAHNVKAEGVVVIPGTEGIQEKLVRRGEGSVHPGPDDTCLVHYRGSLLDCDVQAGPEACVGGTEFDSTYIRGSPSRFSPRVAASFWAHALPRMVRGERREFYVPHAAGFGSSADAASSARQFKMVSPNSTLIFTVELISVEGKDEPPAASAEL